jgi:hypothetical protein
MSFTKLLSISVFLVMMTTPVFAGNEGGGGDQLIIDFIQTANNLLIEPEIQDEHKEVLRSALGTTKIVTVLQLKNPVTGKVIPNQKTLVAWGSPNYIQLKLSSGVEGEVAWDLIKKKGQPIAHLVFHELYRAAGVVNERNESPDETFQLSISKYKLNRYFNHPDAECKVAQKELLEAYVLDWARNMHGRDQNVKVGTQMTMTNVYGSMQCIYEVVYLMHDRKNREFIGRAIFDSNNSRPTPESITFIYVTA